MSNIRYTEKDENVHIWLEGSLDISDINKVKDAFNTILSSGPKIIAINFIKVDFLDSSAIAVLVKLLKGTMSRNTDLVFYDLSPEVLNVFKVASLDKFFKIIPNEEFEKEYSKKVL